MELGHHGTVPGFSYGRIVYFYALPEALDNYKKISGQDIISLPYKTWDPVAYLGSAGFRYIQAEEIIAAGPSVKIEKGKLWADQNIVMWRPGKKGERIKFIVKGVSTVKHATIGLTLSHCPDGGEISVAVNGKTVKFDDRKTIALFEPIQTMLVNHFSREVPVKNGDNEISFESVSGTGKKIGLDFIWVKEF
jgi:hypothetical protein